MAPAVRPSLAGSHHLHDRFGNRLFWLQGFYAATPEMQDRGWRMGRKRVGDRASRWVSSRVSWHRERHAYLCYVPLHAYLCYVPLHAVTHTDKAHILCSRRQSSRAHVPDNVFVSVLLVSGAHVDGRRRRDCAVHCAQHRRVRIAPF